MLVKVDGNILKFPLTESLQFQNYKDLDNKINQFDSHLQDYWMTPAKGEETLNYRYEYEAVCRIISESSDEKMVNKYLQSYFSKVKNDSVAVIKQFIIGILGRKGAITLFEETFLVLYNALIELYESELEEIFEKRYLEQWAIKILIEQSIFLLTLLVKTDYYFSIEELKFKYNHLFFPYFFDGSCFSKDNLEKIDSKLLSNIISKLKGEEKFKTDILEIQEDRRKHNYVNQKVVDYIEDTSTKIKKIFKYNFYEQNRRDVTNKTSYLIEEIFEDYVNYLSFPSEMVLKDFKESLESFGKEKFLLIDQVNLINLIVQDILYNANLGITYNFSYYEERFWEFHQSKINCSRSECKRLYLSTFFFVILYANRIRQGKMKFKYYELLLNTSPEYEPIVENVRTVFKGTKQETIFSKVFEKFISQCMFPNFEKEVKSKILWEQVKTIIKENIDPNVRQEVVADNLKSTERKINKFLQFLNERYELIVDETNKSITALNKKQIEVSSWITEPLSDEELAQNNTIWIGNTINSAGETEFGMVKDGNYSKITRADLYSSRTPEFAWLINEYFSKRDYYYKAEFPDKHIEYGKVYFYDLDEENMSGRYKSSEDGAVGMGFEDRYGRFQINLKDKQLYLTGNGGQDTFGKYRISLQNVKFEENQILAETQYRNEGTVSVTFDLI